MAEKFLCRELVCETLLWELNVTAWVSAKQSSCSKIMTVGVWKTVLRQWLEVYKIPGWHTALAFWGCRGVQSVSLIYPSFQGDEMLQCSLEAFHMESKWWDTTEDPDYNVKYLAKRFFAVSGGFTLNSGVLNWFLQIILVDRMIWNTDSTQ